MFTQVNKLIAEDSYCSYRFSVHFLHDCLRYSARCTKSGKFWILRLGTLENNHDTPGLSISFQFCWKLIKHLLYHIANFDGGTQCVIWGVICIFMKSTSCSSGCTVSPWTWSVLHITGVFSVSFLYTIHRSLRHLHCLGTRFQDGDVSSGAAWCSACWGVISMDLRFWFDPNLARSYIDIQRNPPWT